MSSPENPQLAGEYWVLPTIDEITDGAVRMHVSIAVGDPTELQDSDVVVELFADGEPLALAEGPPSGPLPSLQLIGINAFAQYLYANPENRTPSLVSITVRGGTTEFDLTFANG